MMKTALITGASHGIGEAIARAFADAGYNLALCCKRDIEKLDTLAGELRENHIQVLTYQCDVSDFSEVDKMCSDVLKKIGKIDVLVNNAGISYVGLLHEMNVEEWDRVINTNLSSVFHTAKCVTPAMIQAKTGHIINISSVWGNVGASCEVAYSASKGGVNSFTKALAKELAPSGVSVNAIACGCIDTRMNNCFSDEDKQALSEEIPAGRFGKPEEVAELALSIASTSTYMTGQIITMDGGWT